MDKFLLEDGLKLLPYLCPADENDAVDGLLSQESCDGGRSFTLGSVNDDFVLLFLLDTFSVDFALSFKLLKEESLRPVLFAVLREERDCESRDRAATFRSLLESLLVPATAKSLFP
jgi:hypothetical protein